MLDKKRTAVLCFIAILFLAICCIGISAPKEMIFKSNDTAEEEPSAPAITVLKETKEVLANQPELVTASFQIESAAAVLILLAASFLLCKHVARKNHIFIENEIAGESAEEQNNTKMINTKQPNPSEHAGVMNGEIL